MIKKCIETNCRNDGIYWHDGYPFCLLHGMKYLGRRFKELMYIARLERKGIYEPEW